MKITSETYTFEKKVTGTIEFELDELNPTYLSGRSGGSSYVAVFIPEWYDAHDLVNDTLVNTGDRRLSGFTVISSTDRREGRCHLSAGSMTDWSYLSRELKSLPHGEDILNWFIDEGEKYNHRVCTETDFLNIIRKWRIVN